MNNPFSSINTAGLLLPLDLLTRVGSMDRSLPGMTPADYHVAGSIRLNEAATAAYSRALAYWKSFRKKFVALPASDTGTTLTRDEWLLPLFDCLGYGRLQTKRAISIDSKDYPISHGWEDHVPIHLLSARLPLDKRTQNISGAATRSPYSLVQELLNRSGKHRWGFVSNGLKLYVLRDNASLTRSANIEFDLETMMDGEYHADFTVLFLICHQSRLEIQPNPIADNKGTGKKTTKAAKPTKSATKVSEKPAKYALDLDDDDVEESEVSDDEEAVEIEEPTRLGPENCWLEAWTKLAGEQGTRAKERLRDGVQLAIQTFGAGFYTCSSNAALHQRLRSGELSTQDYYRQLLRLVYRLLMLMVAEDKRTESGQNLLHPIDTPANIRDRYAKFYGIARIRKLANERRGTPHRDLYESLKTTFLKLRDGYAPLGIPGIGSFLFSDTATPDLDSAQITNEALLDAFRNLCFTEDTTGRGGSVRRAVDFGNLGSEELGSIYESLLELHPEIDSQDGPFVLRTAAGNERKTSGSYYTPTSLINCLLDSALDPVVNQAIDVPDREEAKRRLLSLKVCDPACGSGHFLIAAANRMALHLARLETQDTEPTTLQIQHAKRQIIGRCIYGVDINEMAVELCKVSLWMEALEPGKPFSFLENHIKCGNSLLGATPRLLNEGIPDEAFNPIDGDNKEFCTQLKKSNKRERIDHKSGQRSLFEPFYRLGNIADRFSKLSAAKDDTLESVAEKQKEYEELVKGSGYLYARFWADTWCSAFMWKKDDSELGLLCPTERKFREIEKSPHAASAMLQDEVRKIAERFQFFHWHLAFPDVFRMPDDNEEPENRHTGSSRGFDVLIGNPPWEHIELKEKEWFATRSPRIANARTGSERKKLIAALAEQDTQLFLEFLEIRRHHDSLGFFLGSSPVYPLCGRGRINLYTIFAELARNCVNRTGRTGLIVQSGIATDDTTKHFFQDIVEKNSLISLFDFENRQKLFPGVDGRMKFSLITMGANSNQRRSATFAFFCHNISDTTNRDRQFKLTSEEISLLNPNTKTCPVFRSQHDAELAKAISRRIPPIKNIQTDNAWDVNIRRLFNMGLEDVSSKAINADSIGESMKAYVPMFEGKMFDMFNHRASSVVFNETNMHRGAQSVRVHLEDLKRPEFSSKPLYLYPKEELVAYDELNSGRKWFLGYKDIGSTTNERTSIAAILPYSAANFTIRIAFVSNVSPAYVVNYFVAITSFVYDFVVRQFLGGNHLSDYIVHQTPVPAPQAFDSAFCNSYRTKNRDWILVRALELTFTAWDLREFAFDCKYEGPPFCWEDERRFKIRCELDAAFFHLYLGCRRSWTMANREAMSEVVNETLLGMFATPRDAVSYIMDTFTIVRRKDEAKYGEYRTKRVILEIYDQMTEVIEANETIRTANPDKSEDELRPLLRNYQSPLNPPPGPPTDANGNFIPYADWTDEIHRRYEGVIHLSRKSPSRELNSASSDATIMNLSEDPI